MITINFLIDPVIDCDFKNVYYPSDDSYFLIDYFRKKINEDSFDGIELERIEKILDMGTGTGIIAIFFQILKSHYPKFKPKIYASDILEESITCAKDNEILNNINNKIEFLQSDLFKSFPDSLKSKFNIIVFNPPYLPPSPFIKERTNKKAIDHSWDGGYKGIEVIVDFLKEAKRFLDLKNPHFVYYISSSSSKIDELDKRIIALGYKNEKLEKIHMFFEDIILNRIQYNKN